MNVVFFPCLLGISFEKLECYQQKQTWNSFTWGFLKKDCLLSSQSQFKCLSKSLKEILDLIYIKGRCEITETSVFQKVNSTGKEILLENIAVNIYSTKHSLRFFLIVFLPQIYLCLN